MIATDTLISTFIDTRDKTEAICKPLQIEDYVVQPSEHVSPPKWHLGHTTWFFEHFVLKRYKKDYQEYNAHYTYIFNSYYNSVGEHLLRPNRGMMTRPTVKEMYDYRHYVTEEMKNLLSENHPDEIDEIVVTGINHEQQHQELLYTDIKYILGNNFLFPKYDDDFKEYPINSSSQEWISVEEGMHAIGYRGEAFCYDNELMPHRVFIEAYQISNQLVTNGEFIEFIEAGGYEDFNLWHAAGWDWKSENNEEKPLYWHKKDGEWFYYTLNGLKKVNIKAAVAHISYYEAFAYAQWKGCRLPTEFEWEAAQDQFLWGERWEWTESAYLPYPGYKKPAGAIGEYNGKFMVGQKTLRGKSVATSTNHSRPTYRNYFHPKERWQFTGIRLAK